MDLRQLRYFVHVAELGSFTKAAAQLRLTQPALSRQIGRLEDELRVLLLSRHGRSAVLTPAGQILFERARFLIRHSEHARAEVMDLASVPSGQVAIGMPPSVTGLVLPPLMRSCLAHYPAVMVRAMEGFDSAQIEEWLVTGRADLALLYQHKPTPKLTTARLLDEPLFLVMTQGRARRAANAAARDLLGMPMVLPARPHGLRMFLDKVLGMRLKVVVETNALAPIVELVRGDVGVSILPQSAIKPEVDAGTLVARKVGAGLFRPLVLGHYKDHPQTQAERAIAAMIVAEVRALVRAGRWVARVVGRQPSAPG